MITKYNKGYLKMFNTTLIIEQCLAVYVEKNNQSFIAEKGIKSGFSIRYTAGR